MFAAETPTNKGENNNKCKECFTFIPILLQKKCTLFCTLSKEKPL